MNYYYADAQNKAAGPVDLKEIQRLARSGSIRSDPMILLVGQREWKPLSTALSSAPAGPGAGPAAPAGPKPELVQKLQTGTRDAVEALKLCWADPLEGMTEVPKRLSEERLLGVGVALGILTSACVLWLLYRCLVDTFLSASLGNVLKLALVALVPAGSLAGALLLLAKVWGNNSSPGKTCFVAGMASLPGGIVALTLALLGLDNWYVSGAVGVFATSLSILILFNGMVRLLNFSQKASTWCAGLVLLASAGMAKAVYSVLFSQL